MSSGSVPDGDETPTGKRKGLLIGGAIAAVLVLIVLAVGGLSVSGGGGVSARESSGSRSINRSTAIACTKFLSSVDTLLNDGQTTLNDGKDIAQAVNDGDTATQSDATQSGYDDGNTLGGDTSRTTGDLLACESRFVDANIKIPSACAGALDGAHQVIKVTGPDQRAVTDVIYSIGSPSSYQRSVAAVTADEAKLPAAAKIWSRHQAACVAALRG